MLLEENIIDQMSSSVVVKEETQQPIDSLVYSTFVDKFNQEYSDSLNEGQKTLLSHYISSFADNGLELKIYLNEEISRLKEKLTIARATEDSAENTEMSDKLNKVYTILEDTKDRPVDTETLEVVLKTQDLLEEIENNVS